MIMNFIAIHIQTLKVYPRLWALLDKASSISFSGNRHHNPVQTAKFRLFNFATPGLDVFKSQPRLV